MLMALFFRARSMGEPPGLVPGGAGAEDGIQRRY